jgi:hypothetical protein
MIYLVKTKQQFKKGPSYFMCSQCSENLLQGLSIMVLILCAPSKNWILWKSPYFCIFLHAAWISSWSVDAEICCYQFPGMSLQLTMLQHPCDWAKRFLQLQHYQYVCALRCCLQSVYIPVMGELCWHHLLSPKWK